MNSVTLEIYRAMIELQSYMTQFKDYNTKRVDSAYRILKCLYESPILNQYNKLVEQMNAHEASDKKLRQFMDTFDKAESEYKRKYLDLLKKTKQTKEKK